MTNDAPPSVQRIGGRSAVPDAVLGADADCESGLNYLLAVYLCRDDFCGILIEDALLYRLGHDKKVALLKRLLKRHGVDYAPYDRLLADLTELRLFRNNIAHSVAYQGNPWRRIHRRAGQNDVIRLSENEVAVQLNRAMGCQSALSALVAVLATRPAVEPAPTSDDPPLAAYRLTYPPSEPGAPEAPADG